MACPVFWCSLHSRSSESRFVIPGIDAAQWFFVNIRDCTTQRLRTSCKSERIFVQNSDCLCSNNSTPAPIHSTVLPVRRVKFAAFAILSFSLAQHIHIPVQCGIILNCIMNRYETLIRKFGISHSHHSFSSRVCFRTQKKLLELLFPRETVSLHGRQKYATDSISESEKMQSGASTASV